MSVVVSTLRPSDLSNLLTQLLTQSLPSFELVLGLHAIDLLPSHQKQISALNRRKVKVIIEKFSKEKL